MSDIFGKSTKEMIQYAKNIADNEGDAVVTFFHELSKEELCVILKELNIQLNYDDITYKSLGKLRFFTGYKEEDDFKWLGGIVSTHMFVSENYEPHLLYFLATRVKSFSREFKESIGLYSRMGVVRWDEY